MVAVMKEIITLQPLRSGQVSTFSVLEELDEGHKFVGRVPDLSTVGPHLGHLFHSVLYTGPSYRAIRYRNSAPARATASVIRKFLEANRIEIVRQLRDLH